ncbi:MAG: Hint domain-containing protein [Pseudomonadota bacterium]
MSWVGLADSRGAEFDLSGLSQLSQTRPLKITERPGAFAARGTVMLEADVAQFTVPRPLLGHGLGASFGLTVEFGTEDMLDFKLNIGDNSWDHRLPLKITNELQIVRITYAWDVATRAAVLSVYQPRSQHLAQVMVAEPRSIPWAALRSMIHDAPEMCRANEVGFVALSRAFEPAGAMPGLTGPTAIATPEGLRPIVEIEADDYVLSPHGVPRRVIAAVRRDLPARGSFTPHILHAPYLGIERDMVLSGESLVELQGPDVEYLLGVEQVLAEAHQVGEPETLQPEETEPVVRYHQLILEDAELFDAGVGVLSLNLGASKPEGLAAVTTLWADAAGAGLLSHRPDPFPLARPYEIVTLNASRAA